MSKNTKLVLRATTVAMITAAVAPVLLTGTAAAQAPTTEFGGTVWFDRDSDGAVDEGEPGRAGAVVKAKGAGGEFTALTAADGKYRFRGIPLGAYEISHSDPTFANTTPTSFKIVLSPATTATPALFGIRGATICGTVWRDANEDGLRQAGEPVIPNSAVGLESDGSNYQNSGVDGKYCLTDIAAGHQVLGANDRAYFTPSEGWTQQGGDSKFGFTTGRTDPITVQAGETITGIDAGYRVARMDMRTSQLLMIWGGTTYDMKSPDFAPSIQVGDEFTIVGGVYPDGNLAEQLRAKLTLPAGLKLMETFGGMPSTIQGQSVAGGFEGRRHPGAIEFIGVTVRVESAFQAADVRLEVDKGVYADPNLANNILTASIAAIEAETRPTTPAAAAIPANTTKTTVTASLAETGANPLSTVGTGVALIAAGAGALWFTRRRASLDG
ncbi:Carboxypeptidase regulatory-like domain-containing protein [Actinokineospora alba]|uniref:Carboxypeptidase regulatory-like domain-containing protein n=1 Tax=Actinokineospora alba TaxID=504798 RepID=A0A1H0TBP7_9PSEU|nr:SdrD B-like domain-containing protein [Actinokineospora alba]TDP66266.1 SdrD B-like protein [Actinokineospora alba]SDJ20455.1 Carboxypeptidase regulatory-like domain-containing protein [Actinokineospora alba]SDP51275.1 Carboxypeptidase regulatory-like domain-containing protein [Actinokineospora alba]